MLSSYGSYRISSETVVQYAKIRSKSSSNHRSKCSSSSSVYPPRARPNFSQGQPLRVLSNLIQPPLPQARLQQPPIYQHLSAFSMRHTIYRIASDGKFPPERRKEELLLFLLHILCNSCHWCFCWHTLSYLPKSANKIIVLVDMSIWDTYSSVSHTLCALDSHVGILSYFPHQYYHYFSLKGKSTKMHTLLNPPILWQGESNMSSSANFLMHFTLFPPFTNHQYEIELVSLANTQSYWKLMVVQLSPVQDCGVPGALWGGGGGVWGWGRWLRPKEADCWSWWSCCT